MNKKIYKRSISMILSIIMLLQSMSISFAEEISDEPELILNYNFDSAGEVLDMSGNENHATIRDGVAVEAGIAHFDGGYLELPDDIMKRDQLTVSTWIYHTQTQRYARIFDFGGAKDCYYNLMIRDNDFPTAEIRPTGNLNDFTSNKKAETGKWIHMAVTFTEGENILYMDGEEVARSNSNFKPSDLTSNNRNYIGRSHYSEPEMPGFNDPNFSGYMDDFRVYGTALTKTKVQEEREDTKSEDRENYVKLVRVLEELDLGDLSQVSHDINLPEQSGEINFSWSSSNPDIIGYDGTFHATSDFAEEITLTVTASYNGVTKSKMFSVNIKYKEDDEKLQEAADALGIVTLVDTDKIHLPTEGKYGASITWSTSDSSIIKEDGTVKQPEKGEAAEYVDLTAEINYKGLKQTKEFKNRKVLEKYDAYLLTYFGGEELEDWVEEEYATVHFAYSYDGLHWVPLNDNRAVVKATLKGRDNPEYGQDRPNESLARDPMVLREQDGQLRLISSHSWNNHDIYVWDKGDLTEFTGERILSVNTDKGNAWAPEAIYDPVIGKYMIIFTDPNMVDKGSCGFGTYTDDFTQENVNQYIEEGLTNVPLMDLSKIALKYIDCSMYYYDGTYYMPVRYWNDRPRNGVALAKSDSLEANSFVPITSESVGDGNNEGPFIIKSFDEDKWYLYYDYPDGGPEGFATKSGIFGVSWTDDLDSGVWNRVPYDEYSMPYGVRHGNAIPITKGELDNLKDAWGAPDKLEIAQLTEPEVHTSSDTAFENLSLPGTVDVILQDGTSANIPVIWSSDNYQSSAGRYKVYGSFVLPDEIVNTKGFQPFVMVYVDQESEQGLIADFTTLQMEDKYIYDKSGFGNHLLFENDPVIAKGREEQDTAMYFDGEQTASLPKELLMNLTDMTISQWIKIDEPTTWARAFDFGKDKANFINFIPHANDGKMRMEIRVNQEERSIKPGIEFPKSEWVHVAMTIQPESLTGILYINGEEVGRADNFYYGPEHIGMSGGNHLGKSKFGDSNFKGYIEGFLIHDYALTAQQIEQLYKKDAELDKIREEAQKTYDSYKHYKEEEYEKPGFLEYKNALEKLGELLEEQSATKDSIVQAVESLKDAVDKLVPSNLKSIRETIKKAEALKQTDYTDTTWTTFAKTLTEAKKVAADKNATFAQIKTANESLTKAMNALQKKPAVKEAPKAGTVFNSGHYTYKVTKSTSKDRTVTLVKPKKKTMKNVSIPSTVRVEGYTFKVTAVSKKAFYKNSKLTTVSTGNNVQSIDKQAFSGCPKLKKVTIGKNVKTIKAQAFSNCKKLRTVKVNSQKIKTVGKNAFNKIHKSATIRVPKKKVNAYKRILKKSGIAKSVVIK